MRSLVAAVVLLAPSVAFAQTGDVGVTFIPALFQHLDEPPVCCAASGWITLGSGPRFRMHVDYVQSRRRSEGYGGYPHDELIDGRMASTRRDSLTRETLHDINVLAAWRAVVREGVEVRVLFGGALRYTRGTFCVAFAGPSVRIPAPPEYGRDHILLHARLTDEDHRRCADNGYGRGWIFPQVGVAVDWPLGDAFFIRADARLMLPRVGVGAGFRF